MCAGRNGPVRGAHGIAVHGLFAGSTRGYDAFPGVAAATDLPIMIYNNRVAYKVDLTPESFVQLANVENIVAVMNLLTTAAA